MNQSAETGVAHTDDHYRALWNHAVDAELIIDGGGIIRDVNRRTELKLGRLAAELVGARATTIFLETDRLRVQRLLDEVFLTAKETSARGLHVPVETGAVLTIDLDLVPIENPTGGGIEVLLQLTDMTERRRLEEQLLRSERLASLSQFASMFAHDIRNPLAGIKKALEVLAGRPELQNRPLSRWLGDLQLTTDLLLGMINDMLDVYQESYAGLPLIVSTFPVRALFEESIYLFRPEAEAKGVSFRLDYPRDEILISGDRRRLQRVGINLIHNALKYSPPNGVITISVKQGREGMLPLGMGQPGDAVLLMRVEDEGPGIHADDLPHLFEMFFRKKDGHDLRIGRGLGLHFCRLVVEAHHGRIWAANRVGGGGQFSIALPAEGMAS